MNKSLIRKLESILFLGLLLVSVFSFLNLGSAAGPLTLKWTKNLGGLAKTYIAPLSVDLTGDGKMEVVVVGGSVDYGSDGTVTALDGATGNIIWQVAPGGIGMHTPFEIADINKDGIQEIVIAGKSGAFVLHGNDGSLYWRNTNAPAEENYPAVADVNGDGYLEIFVCRGYGPYNGYDWITSLTYDGQIIKQAWNWHPCWGGLTVGDTNSDGVMELFQGDRSYSYNPSEDPYKYGGMGVRALDALTLTPLWNDSDILSSSHAPMLGDVDNDGKLDVIAAYQSNGVVVLNATDGTVLNTGGKYRKSANTGMPAHSQPTILDIDGDGHLELMDSRDSNPVIFDLYDWQVEATLPVRTIEPPKVGDVTGDGVGDIIAVTSYTPVMTIFSYDPISKQYVQVQNVSGLLNANAFTLIQDIDNDGFNELVLSSSTGNVYAYDTLGIAPTPRARTGFQFFSERKLGVAEYVPPPGPLAPQVSDPAPLNGATNVPVTTSQLAFTLKDFQGNPINFTVTTSPNIGGGNGTNVPNGRYSVPIVGVHYGTLYSWTVTATDGQNTNSKTHSFTTEAQPPQAPWWNTNWPYRRKITINATRINGDQTNLPLLIDITNSGFTAKAQSNGNDFVFTDSGQIKLSHEIEFYDSSSGHLIAWVRIPFLSASQDTVLYLYYGNPLASNQQNPSAVWDPNYMMVQHLDEKTGLHFDSTANANNGAPLNGVLQGIAGEIDGADGFDGVNDYVEVPHSDTLAGYGQGFTVSFWLKFDDVSRRQTIINKFNQTSATQKSWFVEFSPTNGLGLFASANGADYAEWHTPTFKPTVGTWYYITLVWVTNSVPTFYVNGQQLSSTGTARILQIYNNVGIPLAIGKSTYTLGREFKGTIDEIRLSNIARTTGWMLTSYGIERDPTSLYSLGTEEIFAAPQGPVLTNPLPLNGAIGIDLNPTLTITANDYPAQPMNVTFSTNLTGVWQDLGTYTNVGNGIYTQSVLNMNDYNTTYYWRVNATDGSYSTNGTYSFTTRPLLSNWWNTGWQYRRTITISHTKVQANQNNFPFLIDITDSAIAAKAQSSGNDLVFVDSNGVKLDHEIELYTSGNGHLTAWVRIPFLSASQDTVLYLYYGNPVALNQQNPSAVWDSGFKMVQHLEESGGPRNDSSSNAFNALASGGVTKASPGKIDGADVFDGASGNLRQADISLFGQNEIFMESWIYVNSVPAAARFAKTHMYGRTLPSPLYWYGMWMGVPNTSPVSYFAMSIRLYNPSGAGSILSYSYTVTLVDQWVHVAIGLSKVTNRTYFYVNGALVKSDDITTALSSGYTTPLDDSLVKGFSVGSNIVGGEFLKMMSDELRISNVIRSTSWTLTCYNEQKDPSTFYALGIEESLPTEPIVTNPSPANGATGVPISSTSLSFNLTDYQNDLLTYIVTTSPNIGSGSQPNVLNGRYTVAVQNLTYATTYSWTVNVTDGVHRTVRTFTFTTEATGPIPPANDIVFDSSFDMGNLRNVQFQSADALGNRYYTAEQNHTTVSFTDKHWWFYFSMDNATGKAVTVKFVNNEAIDFSTNPSSGNRWPNIEPVFSYDNLNWERLPLTGVSYDRTAATYTITITVPLNRSKVWLAPVPPYTIHKRDALFEEFKSSPYLTVTNLGTTVGGQNVTVATITDPAYSDAGKFKSYVLGQQHAGELGSWNAEGLIRFLLSDDPTAVLIRRSYIFKIVPIVNVDGVYQGVSRYTPLRGGVQYDLNRLWNTNPISNAPVEVRAIYQDIQAFQPNSFNDFHSTINTEQVSPQEALTYTWSTTNTAFTNFMDRIRDGGYPETVRAISSLAGGAFQNIHSRLGIAFSVSWENPMSELSSRPGVKLNISDWMTWGAGWAKGNYLYFGDAPATLNVQTTGSGTVSLNDTGPYHYGSVVQLTAVPSQNWQFSQWTGDLTGSQNPAVVTMTGNKTITAVFSQIQYALTLFNDGNGSVSEVPSQTVYAPGTNVTLTAIPDLGWSFTSWSGDLTGSLNPTWIIMDANKTVTAHFVQNYYTLDVNYVGSGSVTKLPDQASYAYGSQVNVTAVPDSGWQFSYWNGSLGGGQNPLTIIMDANISLTANFVQNQYTLTVNINGNGTVNKSPDQATYTQGTVVNLTAIADPGSAFANWTGDVSSNDNSVLLTMNGNKVVTATFTQDLYVLTVNVDGSGSVVSNPNQTSYVYGEQLSLTATPAIGWRFAGWSGDASGNTTPLIVTMTSSKTINATFTPNQAPNIDSYTPTVSYPSTSQGNPQGFTVNATDPDGDTLTYAWYLDGAFVAGADSYMFTPTSDSSGAHNITVQVSDGNGAQAKHNWFLTVDANLVMPFDTSTTPIADYSGLGNNGTPVGPTWTPNGKIGGAYFFDGVNDYIRIPDSVSLDGDGTWDQITIEFWINITANQNGKRVIAKRFGGSTGGPYSYQIGFQTSGASNRMYFDIWNPNLYEVEINVTLTPLSLNTWYHIACVYKSGIGSKIYINGVDVNAVKVVTNPVGTETGLIRASRGQSLFIGCRNGTASPYNPQDFFSGMIDELRIYPRALNSTQINQSFYLASLVSFSPVLAPTAMYVVLSFASTLALFALIAVTPKRQRKPLRLFLPFIYKWDATTL